MKISKELSFPGMNCLTVSPDPVCLVYGDSHGLLWGIDLETGAKKFRWIAQRVPVTAAALNSDFTLAAVGGAKGGISIIGIADGETVRTLPGHSEQIDSLFFAADRKELISGDTRGLIDIWRYDTGDIVRSLSNNSRSRSPAYVSAKGLTFLTGDTDGGVSVWDLENRKILFNIRIHESAVTSAVISSDESLFATGDFNGEIAVRKAPSSPDKTLLRCEKSPVTALAISGDGKLLACANDNGKVYIWDISSGTPSDSFQTARKTAQSLFFIEGSKKLILRQMESVTVLEL